nr:hypothetical protein B0A51_14429 [Rachicladosporium sp. CCFEE 5018]
MSARPVKSKLLVLETDASGFDDNGALPTALPSTISMLTARSTNERFAASENLTVRQLAQRFGGYSGLAFVGEPGAIAEEMKTWLDEEACDGFTVVFPYLPQGLDDVTERLVPELQKRGILRKECEGKTLREHLGLPRPGNRFFEKS